ncbi:MAG: hypothetical protein NC337_08035 [Roseburia sp.]|nr:hypothetical protein [Roseburia sp.]
MKRHLFMLLLALLPALLSACGAKAGASEPQTVIDWSQISGAAGSEAAADKPSADKPQQDTALSATVDNAAADNAATDNAATDDTKPQTTTPADNGLSEPYRQLYAQAVTENTDPVSFSLIYLDNDDIPELVVTDNYYGATSIYTVKDGAVSCMVDALFTVELTYFERGSVIAAFARWNGGGDEGGYGQYYYQTDADNTVTDDTMPLLSFDYNAVYDEDGNYTGEGVTRYFRMGEEVDAAAYQEALAGFGITEDSDRLCAENSMTKEELLRALNP